MRQFQGTQTPSGDRSEKKNDLKARLSQGAGSLLTNECSFV